MQHPILKGINGDGFHLDQHRVDSEVLDAWEDMVEGVEAALMRLHPAHPQRHEFVAMRTAFRAAARLPERPFLEQVG